ncbi:MAG TPA: TonB-dependent receptor [Geomonas sp.]|nr:TonB-dependent receptor [Geomonas sp.]
MEIRVATVFGASRFEQKVTDAPASVTIITADEIRKYGYRSLAEILRSIPGVFITNDRNYSYIGVSGFDRPGDYNGRVLLLVDGHRMNDSIYGQAPIGMEFPLDVDLIDRLEFIRGPGSSLYGANAFFGVINIYTKSGEGVRGAEVSASAASRETFQGRLTYGNRFGSKLEGLLSGTLYSSEGYDRLYYQEFNSPATNNGVATDADRETAGNLFGKFTLGDFTLSGVYSSREKHIPTASFGTVFDDSRTRTTDQRSYLDLNYAHTFDNDLGLKARLFFDDYHYYGNYAYDLTSAGLPATIAVNKDTAYGEWWGAELQLTKTFCQRHKLTLGSEIRDNIVQEQKNYFDEASLPASFRVPILDDRRRSYVWAVYFQDEFHLLNNLILNAGVRYDHYSTFGGTANPRAALIYHPLQSTALKFIYGEAFRAPNAFELYYNDGGASLKANPDLKPEKIYTYELVWEQYIGEHLRSSASGFYYRINDLISQQVDPVDGLLVFQNIDRVKARGTELELDGNWGDGWQGKVSYTYQDVDLGDGAPLSNTPHSLVKANLSAPLVKDRLFASPELQFTGSRATLSGGKTDGYVVVNLTLFSKELVKGLELSASVYNIFNNKYGDPGSSEHRQAVITQDGRTVRAKITYRF